MKRRIYIYIIGIMVLLSLNSCSEWLDETPKTDVPAPELFETENGFMSALAGLYITMTGEDTYGKNLSFELVEQLAQMYDKIPDGANGNRNSVYIYDRETSGAYNTKGTIAGIWQAQYHIIANANNLLKWLDQNGEVVITNEDTRNMIRGEALAIRAYLHFDLLRAWGPMNYANDAKAQDMECIPYRTVADKSKQPLLTAKKVVNNILQDLNEAKKCLSYEKEVKLNDINNINRNFRFNYHAINATLARVYNYAGQKEKAMECALSVIKECGLTLVTSNENDPILSKEVICGLSMHEMEDYMSNHFSAGDKIETKNYIEIETLKKIFDIKGTESEDLRAKGTAFTRNTDLKKAITRKYIDNENQVIPLIRLPEMYYIACESAEGDDAMSFINTVRNKRGLSQDNNIKWQNDLTRIEALNDEYRKEFYAEGQYFWFLKTHGLTGALKHREEVSLTKEMFIFPLPDREKEFGWIAEEEEDKTGETATEL